MLEKILEVMSKRELVKRLKSSLKQEIDRTSYNNDIMKTLIDKYMVVCYTYNRIIEEEENENQ